MRFRLSTLLLITACIALAIGWFVDRYTNRVPSYEERLADHARLAATLADVHRLHQFSDHPQGYIKRVPDMLFIVFIDLYRNRNLFARTYGPIGNARHIDDATLHWLGNETLRRIDITNLSEFEAELTASGLGTPQYYDLYEPDGSLRPELRTFVSACFAAPDDLPTASDGG
ncbi:hypothetical protein [Rhodopirellula baltica]|uniref:Uncharacterized protein n=1 Tax=Rhodopirellula baltica SWK14 TaxID=993516 RepID=L7C6Z7_RHOBT|nr:hypothetical protein [Rhodopirellula baltica]ELP29452.1 hypothetical protein RBSWK_06619 [Rhodopirellula baltica SWK14]